MSRLLAGFSAAVVIGLAIAGLLTGHWSGIAHAGVEQMPPVRTSAPRNAVPQCVTPNRLMAFLAIRNPQFPAQFADIAQVYRVSGRAYGVRWDYAFFQMLMETNNLSFEHADGTPRTVRPDQNNFAAIGAAGLGNPGERFASIAEGVQAHIEHILIYSGQRISNPVADRTAKVQRWGLLEDWLAGFTRPVTFRDLALRWFPFNESYARNLRAVAAKFYAAHCPSGTVADAGAGDRGRHQLAALSAGWVARDAANAPSRAQPRAPAGGTGDDAPIRPPVPRLVERTSPLRVAALDRRDPLPTQRRDVTGLTRSPAPQPPTKRSGVNRKAAPKQPVKKRPKAKTKPKRKVARAIPRKVAKPDPNAEVRQLVSGRLVHLKTDMGATIPIRFDKTGRMSGRADGLAFFLGAARDSGKWWVKRQRLCKRWKVWLSRKTMCLKLKKRGRVVHWRAEDGRSGTARIIR